MKILGIVVDTYTHAPTGASYDIRYRKSDKMHYAMVGQVEVANASFDKCLELLKATCEKSKLVVWVPAISATNTTGNTSLRVERYDLAIREDGCLATCAWEIPGNTYQRISGVKRDDMTDELRVKHAFSPGFNYEYVDAMMAALTEGRPYALDINASNPTSRCVWFPYSEGLWLALTEAVKIQANFSTLVLDFLSTASTMQEAVARGKSPYKIVGEW